jgi:imidazolonepropionase-like amidohydrolase
MRKITKRSLVLVVAAAAMIASFSAAAPPREPLVLAHVTVIDVAGGPTFSDAAVVIEGGRILAVGKSAGMVFPGNARIIDGTGKFLIPGLWDMHVHISHEEIFFPLLVAHGISGIREMGNDFDLIRSWRKAIGEGRLLGPRIFAAGPIIDGPDIRIPKMRINAATEEEGRAAVDGLKKRGVDFIKVWSLLSRPAYFGIADEAIKTGLTFVGHVPLNVTAREASEAGQKSIEHLANILLGCSREESRLMKERSDAVGMGTPGAALRFLEFWFYRQSKELADSFDTDKARDLFRMLHRKETWICPTLSLWRPYAFPEDPVYKNDSRLKYVPNEWNPKTMWFLKDQTEADLVQVRKVFVKNMEIVGAMHREGVLILAGTDTPNIHLFPGFALHDELALLVEAGLTPLEALQTATINPAIFMGTLNSMGTVEKGKRADLVVLDADPRADISNLGKIRSVVIDGRFLDRAELDGLMEKARSLSGK